ncbi:hypothetical protein Ahy_B05g077974 isoform C [Arachis hypogaea]|uniref:Uncharacterized protein n=1 Tax=Arachis hypogaea TaxID=3818 RepID=A0A444Z612_ARAHY|nr:hypothetical protein Ahy_B05g077974 isoform C [Arachis hypogaea]
MKKRYIFNTKPIHQNTHSLRISLNITQTSITFSAEITTAKESEEDFANNNQKQTKTATKTTKAKHNKKMTMKEKAHYNKTHYCRCQTKAIATVYREMSQEKKDIVEEMGFGALENVPKMNVSNTLLKELLDRFDEEKGCLKTVQEKIYITPRKVAAALGITNGGNRFPKKVDYNNLNPADKEIFDSVKNISLATLIRNVLHMIVEGEENRKKCKRTFVVFIQKCFLLPTTVSVASPIHRPPIFHVDNIREWD